MNIQWTWKKFIDLSPNELHAVLKLRAEVFIQEQNCVYVDPDIKDINAIHLIGRPKDTNISVTESPEIIAYSRILIPETKIQNGKHDIEIGRVVVPKVVRKMGLGRQLMQKSIELGRELKPNVAIKISAQAYLERFYSSFGFQKISEPYLEDGIPHIGMLLSAPPPDWNQIFGSPDFFYGSEPNDFLRETAPSLMERSKILSLAEGEGRNAVFLATLGHDVHAIDLSTAGKQKALRLAESKKVSIDYTIEGVLKYAYPPESYDAVVMIFLHLPPDVRFELFKRINQTLKPGGVLIAEVYSPRQLKHRTGGPSNVSVMMEVQDFKNAFPNYKILTAHEIERSLSEGVGHVGLSAVVQIHLQKPESR